MVAKPVPTGLVGGSYNTQSVRADGSRTINWYPERIESGHGDATMALFPTPGLSVFCTIGDGSAAYGPVRGSHYINGHLLVVARNHFYEVSNAGVEIDLGFISNDNKQVSMSSNTYQTLIIADGLGYIYSGGVLTQIASAAFPGNIPGVRALKGGYIDGYFFVLADNNFFYISALNDGTSWNLIDSSSIEASANKLIGMIIDHEEVFVFGSRIGQALHNTGNSVFPFEAVPSGTIEQGMASADSIAKSDNSFMFVVEDDRGAGVVVRINAYLPQRISDHGVDYQIQRAIKAGVDITKAIGWSYQADGHSFYMLNIPGMDTSFCYDSSTKLWHERAWWNPTFARYEAHRGVNHIYAFDKHLVGDRELGLLYDMDINTYTDNGAMIRRLRRHPHIQTHGIRLKHKLLQIYMETGVGLGNVTPTTLGYDPQLLLEYSDDGGQTFANSTQTSIGKAGEFKIDVEFRGLGSTEVSRVYQLIATSPVPYRMFESYLTAG